MKTVILDRATLGDDFEISIPYESELEIYNFSLNDDVTEAIRDADIIFENKIRLTGEVLAKAPKLKLICETATGYDNIDIEYCRAHGIAVCNVPGYSSDSVAQLTLTMALDLVNHMQAYREFVKCGDYTKSGVANCLKPVFHEIRGKVWGVVGYGNIGKKVAMAAEAMGCRIIAFKKTPTPEVECTDIDTLTQTADIISVHLPLTDETRNIFSRERIDKMKKDAVFINVARGAVVDEEALCDAVENGKIGGIGVDVYSKEPLGEDSPYNRIKHLENVCLTPHMAWGAYEARERCFNEVVKNAQAFLNGEIRNRVDL